MKFIDTDDLVDTQVNTILFHYCVEYMRDGVIHKVSGLYKLSDLKSPNSPGVELMVRCYEEFVEDIKKQCNTKNIIVLSFLYLSCV